MSAALRLVVVPEQDIEQHPRAHEARAKYIGSRFVGVGSGEFHIGSMFTTQENARLELRAEPAPRLRSPNAASEQRLKNERSRLERVLCARMFDAVLERLRISNRDFAALERTDEKAVRKMLNGEAPLELRHLLPCGVPIAVLEEIVEEALRKTFKKESSR